MDNSENDSYMGMLQLLRLAMDTKTLYVAKTGIPYARGSVKVNDYKAVIRPILNRDKLSRGSTVRPHSLLSVMKSSWKSVLTQFMTSIM